VEVYPRERIPVLLHGTKYRIERVFFAKVEKIVNDCWDWKSEKRGEH
jgi:hypothetical protein